MAYAVSRRRREIGLRMALGATGGRVLRGILGQGLRLILAGLGIGLIGALALTRLMAGFLYEVSSVDPFTWVCVSLLLTGLALLACYLPARRAARIDPMEALRYE